MKFLLKKSISAEADAYIIFVVFLSKGLNLKYECVFLYSVREFLNLLL